MTAEFANIVNIYIFLQFRQKAQIPNFNHSTAKSQQQIFDHLSK